MLFLSLDELSITLRVAPEVLSVYRANKAELILAERINNTKKGVRGRGWD